MSQRLFVGVWPSAPVVAALEGLDRPEDPAVRWTTAAQWHVTLAFLGDVADGSVEGLVASLRTALGGSGRVDVALGATASVLGRTALVLAVGGLDDLAARVAEAVRAASLEVPDRRFRGHLTLARGRGRRPIPPAVRAARPSLPAPLGWTVDHVDLVRSERRSDGAVYEAVASVAL